MFSNARALGFTGINVDLVYGLPFQSPPSWQQTLERIAELRPDRVAVYSFAYVPRLRPHQRLLPVDALSTGKAKLEPFLIAREVLVGNGYVPIGMDHFALADDELAAAARAGRLTRNFQGYTVRHASDLVAFGATGISDVKGTYAQNARPLGRYDAALAAGKFATERGLTLTDDDIRRRDVIQQLMCNGRVDWGADGAVRFAAELEALRQLEDEGLLVIDGTSIVLKPLGHLFVRNVAMAFDARAGARVRSSSRSV